MKKKIIIFDLDETLLLGRDAEDGALLMAGAVAHEKYGIVPGALNQAVRDHAYNLWLKSPASGESGLIVPGWIATP